MDDEKNQPAEEQTNDAQPTGSASLVPIRASTRGDANRRLKGRSRQLIVEGLASYCTDQEIAQAVKAASGETVNTWTIRHYRDSPKWQLLVRARRDAMERELDKIPISSRSWRQKTRMKLLDEAREQPGRDLGTARQLLLDAAKEAGHVTDSGAVSTHVGTLNLQVIQQVLALPREALEEYARTGRLDPSTYALDVKVARELAGADGQSDKGPYVNKPQDATPDADAGTPPTTPAT